jgi:hypothetical protein
MRAGCTDSYYAPRRSPISGGVSTSVKVSGALHAFNEQEPI